MTEQNSSNVKTVNQHAYYRTFDAKDRNSVTTICDKVPAGSLVLDLGAGSGIIGKYLSTEKKCTVDGIDINLEQVEHAACYRKIQSANLEAQLISELISDQYDIIICADLLEHLRNPQQLLVQLKDYLKQDGRIILSVPNVAHIGLVCDLIEGAFEYRSEGLLDNTHVRFFTRHSLKNLLSESGLGIKTIEEIELDPRETEFNSHPYGFSPELMHLLISRADALTYQFIIEASFDDEIAENLVEEKHTETLSPVSLSYSVQLFWRTENEEYDTQQSVTAVGRIGKEIQQFELKIPEMGHPCSALRLGVADRPGYTRIETIKLCNASGAVVWEWDGNADTLLSLGSRQEIEIADLRDSQSGVVVLVGTEDSYFELPVPTNLLEEISSGGSLQLTQSFPMSADYLALTPRLSELTRLQVEQIDELKKLVALRDSELVVRDATIKAHQSSPEEREQLIIDQQHQIEELKHLSELQAQQIQEREQLIDERDKWLIEKQDRAERQYEKMEELELLMKQHNIDITRRTSNVEFREQSIDQQLQIRDDSINSLTAEIGELEKQLEHHMSLQFWLQRPFVFLRDTLLNKLQ